jgi:hypothetical protein
MRPRDDREFELLLYIATGLYGAFALYWYRAGARSVIEPDTPDKPCGCHD